jgi:hypothetical protein
MNPKGTICLLITLMFFARTYSQEMKVEWKQPFGNIQFEDRNDKRIFLGASYGSEKFEMMIDTYAFFSSLPEDWVIKKWSFAKTPYISTTTDFNNKRSKINLRLMDHLEVANNFSATQFYIRPNKVLNQYHVGVLAADFLNDLNWKFDISNRVLFYDTAAYDLTKVGIRNNFDKSTSFPWLMLRIADFEHKLVVDLGARDEITIPADSELGKWLIRFYGLTPKEVTMGGANSNHVEDDQYRVLLDSIHIENQVIRKVTVRLSKNTKVSYIGCELLKRGILYLNYLNRGKGSSQVGFEMRD